MLQTAYLKALPPQPESGGQTTQRLSGQTSKRAARLSESTGAVATFTRNGAVVEAAWLVLSWEMAGSPGLRVTNNSN